jgi:polar amino acid transport system substrate-binding protein
MKNFKLGRSGLPARALACVLSLLATSAAAQAVVLRVLGQESIEPKWIFTDGRARGMCPDILEAIGKQEPGLRFAGYERARSLRTIDAGLATGEVVGACALLDSPERRATARIAGKPLYMARQRLAATSGDTAVINSIDDLVRLKALVNAARGAAFVAQLRAKGVDVDDSTGDHMVNVRKILGGHGRFIFMNELTLLRYIASEQLEGKIKMLPVVLMEEPVYFWISKKTEPAIASRIEQALDKLAANGELNRIYERWSAYPGASVKRASTTSAR